MINVEKQIEYWKNGACDDLDSAKILIEKNRLLHGLFFCHLVIEKNRKNSNMVKREIIELLKKYILLLNTEGISVNKAFLYGSYLNDSATETSDIDVMIVSDKYDETNDKVAGKVWKLTKKISTKIEPFLIGLNKFKNDDTSPLISMVKSKGIEIV